MRSRSSDHRAAPAGSRIGGRKTPHVSGMERVSRERNTGTGRSIPSERERSETWSVQDCVASGTAREEIRARRKRPKIRRNRTKRKPANQISRKTSANLLRVGEAATALTIVVGRG